jgi:hypothetical protein
MAEPLRPNPVKTFGRENWIFVPSIADTSAPTVAEVTGASTLDITRIVFRDAGPNFARTTNVVTQNARYGDTVDRQAIGKTTYGNAEMFYQFDPQAASGANGRKAYEKFLNTSATVTGYLVRRQAVQRAVAVAAAQNVDIYPVEFGPSQPTNQGSEDSVEAAASCTVVVTDTPAFNVAIAA